MNEQTFRYKSYKIVGLEFDENLICGCNETVKGAKQTPPLQPFRHNLALKMNHIFAFDILIYATWPEQNKNS